MTDRYVRCDAEGWLEETPATDASDYTLTIDQALDRMGQRLSLTRVQANGDRNPPAPDRRWSDHPSRSRLLWAGGAGLLLSLAAMIWAIIATLPLIAARGEYFMQAGAAALARSLPAEPTPRRWPQ